MPSMGNLQGVNRLQQVVHIVTSGCRCIMTTVKCQQMPMNLASIYGQVCEFSSAPITIGSHSVGIVRLWTKGHGVFLFYELPL
jgi:hypothetical protein